MLISLYMFISVMILCVGILIGWNWGMDEERAEWEDKVVARGYGSFVIHKKRVVFEWNHDNQLEDE